MRSLIGVTISPMVGSIYNMGVLHKNAVARSNPRDEKISEVFSGAISDQNARD